MIDLLSAALGVTLCWQPDSDSEGAGISEAVGPATYGEGLGRNDTKVVRVRGEFRTRGALLSNLDLDRGPTPSGQMFFPVPLSDPSRQTLSRFNGRLRLDVGLFAPRGWVALKTRVDALDNLEFGSAPRGTPATSTSQNVVSAAVAVRRAYAEFLTPLGLLIIGRVGNHWGLGMLANSGDCDGCDSVETSDRVAFVTQAFRHVFALSYDFTATGPFSRGTTPVTDLDPRTNVHTVGFAALRRRSASTRLRRRAAGRSTVDYGLYSAYRWQKIDVPATSAIGATSAELQGMPVQYRGYSGLVADTWLRVETPWLRVELEAAYQRARIERPSVGPGIEFRDPLFSDQFGAALESEVGRMGGRLRGGLHLGFASGDPAPGFGAQLEDSSQAAVPGDLNGGQASLPFDGRVDNFRFHPDYRVDRILFRELIGTVTDAAYVRPYVGTNVRIHPKGALAFELAAVSSFAVYRSSTPGGASGLGIELDPTIRYETTFGFSAEFAPAVLFPLAGLDNVQLGLAARSAQLYRLRLQYRF